MINLSNREKKHDKNVKEAGGDYFLQGVRLRNFETARSAAMKEEID